MPVRLTLCDLGAPGWGSPGFRIVLCCFVYSQISCMAMFVFGSSFSFSGFSAIPILGMIQ